MKCNICGHKSDFPYCPFCGQPLHDSTLSEIAKYCRVHQKSHEDKVASMNEAGCVRSERIARRQRYADKWKRWADTIESLINKSESSHD